MSGHPLIRFFPSRFVEGSFNDNDIDAMAASQTAWNQQYEQIGRGRFQGGFTQPLLADVRGPRDTEICKLEPAFRCRSCSTKRYKPPVHLIKLTKQRELNWRPGITRQKVMNAKGGRWSAGVKVTVSAD